MNIGFANGQNINKLKFIMSG